jgi:monovalent cation/hydrogen antiporter
MMLGFGAERGAEVRSSELGAQMHEIIIVLGLLAVVAALVPLADRLAIPYPILLVLGGLLLGFIPNHLLPDVTLEPDLIFLLFLPPLLYWEAVTTPWREFRANLRPIGSLAIGLVVVTTCGVAIVAHALLGFAWPVSFVLGAVVSSTDAVAAGSIAARLGVPPRIVAILQGESLINDATALVVYGAAVTAVVAGSFSLPRAALQFVAVSVGGVAAGLVVGWIVIRLRPHIADARVEGMVALLTPFAAYLPADLGGASGVLAAVAAGLYVGRQSAVAISPAARLRADAIWELGTFLINGLIFILIGLQLHPIVIALSDRSLPALLWQAIVVSLAVIALRIAWVYPAGALAHLEDRIARKEETPLSHAELGIIGWAGMRGVISLATALALPEVTHRGPFPERDLILFLTFGVIVATLVGQGLTLAPLIRLLHVTRDDALHREEVHARRIAAQAAMERLNALARRGDVPAEVIDDVRARYRRRAERLGSDGDAGRSQTLRGVARDVLDAERRAIIDLRDRNVISDAVLRRIQHELDLEHVRLEAGMQQDE